MILQSSCPAQREHTNPDTLTPSAPDTLTQAFLGPRAASACTSVMFADCSAMEAPKDLPELLCNLCQPCRGAHSRSGCPHLIPEPFSRLPVLMSGGTHIKEVRAQSSFSQVIQNQQSLCSVCKCEDAASLAGFRHSSALQPKNVFVIASVTGLGEAKLPKPSKTFLTNS